VEGSCPLAMTAPSPTPTWRWLAPLAAVAAALVVHAWLSIPPGPMISEKSEGSADPKAKDKDKAEDEELPRIRQRADAE